MTNNTIQRLDSVSCVNCSTDIFSKWNGKKWIEDKAAAKEVKRAELESELNQLKIDLVFAQAMGDPIEDIEVGEEL